MLAIKRFTAEPGVRRRLDEPLERAATRLARSLGLTAPSALRRVRPWRRGRSRSARPAASSTATSAGNGSPALLLHGGPGLPDYTERAARPSSTGPSRIFRYTQRGALPSTVGPPYSVETHMADALAVLDAFGLEQAWAIGHSWGGHLALHLAVAHPERLYGVVCIDTLGASATVIPEFQENLLRALSEAERARAKELDGLAERGAASHGGAARAAAARLAVLLRRPGRAPRRP